MSYTIVDDEGVIQVRAAIRTADEMEQFLEKLAATHAVLETAKQEKPE